MREICHIGVCLSLTPFAGVNANIPIAASGKEGFENVSSRMYLTRLGQPLSRAGAEHGGLVHDLTQTQAPPPPPPPSTSHQSRLTAAAGNHPFSTGTASQVGSGGHDRLCMPHSLDSEQLRASPGGIMKVCSTTIQLHRGTLPTWRILRRHQVWQQQTVPFYAEFLQKCRFRRGGLGTHILCILWSTQMRSGSAELQYARVGRASMWAVFNLR